MAVDSASVSWGQLSIIVGVISGTAIMVGGVAAWLFARISSVQREHDQFRVEVAEKFQSYVSTDNLTKVEERIEAVVKELREDFRRGFDSVIELMKSLPGVAGKSGKTKG